MKNIPMPWTPIPLLRGRSETSVFFCRGVKIAAGQFCPCLVLIFTVGVECAQRARGDPGRTGGAQKNRGRTGGIWEENRGRTGGFWYSFTKSTGGEAGALGGEPGENRGGILLKRETQLGT